MNLVISDQVAGQVKYPDKRPFYDVLCWMNYFKGHPTLYTVTGVGQTLQCLREYPDVLD